MTHYSIPPRLFRAVLVSLVGFTLLYVLVYVLTPFPAPWSDICLNLAISIPAFLAALFSTLVWRTFRPGDAPRPVWLNFALGLWCWTLAESIWLAIWLLKGDVFTPSIPDFFWTLAYVFFGLAFMYQYRLIHRTTLQKQGWRLLGVVIVVLLATIITTVALVRNPAETNLDWIETFFNIFYVFADLGITLAALGLARLFGRGLWGRAWIALLVMTLSDALYSFVDLSGLYALSAESGNLLSLTTDTLYALAYFILALACYGQYLLVQHGPSLTPRHVIAD